VAALSAALLVAALIPTVGWLGSLQQVTHVSGIGWLSLTAAFALAEALPAHFEHRREAVSISLTAVPLVVGLFAVAPVVLVAARLGGSAVTLIVVRRQRPLKLATNVASFWVQTLVTIAVFHALVGQSLAPSHWPGVVVAVVLGDTVQTVILTGAICLYQRRWEHGLRDTALVGTGAALLETSVGLVAISLLLSQPAALLPLAVITALVLFSLRTYRSLGEHHRELGELYEFTSAIGGAQLDDRVLHTVLERARDLMRAERAWLYLDDGHGGLLAASSTPQGVGLVTAPREASDLHRAAHAAGCPVVVGSGDDHDRQLLHAADAADLMLVPLTGPSGAIGTLAVADRRGEVRGFEADDARLFATLANHASVSLENDRLVNRLREKATESEHQSLHDALTGLPNRVLFSRCLEEALTTGAPAAVLLLDLDRFKEVNDTLGHHNGDLLLQQVGDRLRGTLRRGDVIARLGGDEFAVLLPDIHAEQAALQAGRGIVELLEQPFVIGDMSVDVGASIGIAVAPRDGSDAVTLVQRADVAMYIAKVDQTGVETYRSDRDGYSPERLQLVSELKQAVHDRQLTVHYQPQVALSTNELVGVEALVRWHHPTRGDIRPDEFIPVAEHTGLIRPLTLFVLDEALAESRQWRQAGHHLRVSVNLSPRSLLQPTLADDIGALLRRYDTPVGMLRLEVTESSIMADPRRTAVILESLRDLGVTVAIDDFGTGHSSLAYIKRLPVSEIKIDKSFVLSMLTDRSDETIVSAVINLGSNLGLEVVAEGVENDATRALLEEMGCPTAQGYFFSAPMPHEQLMNWLARESPQAPDCVVVAIDEARGAVRTG
jgi:diguanylate cyclase (GGDEF)-like protein